MLKKAAIVFGVVFILVGIAGFIPALAPVSTDTGHAQLFGLFAVDPVHNWVHILSGVVALICGFAGAAASRTYFQVFGVVYGLVTILGLFTGVGELLGIMAHNWADVVLHLVITIAALVLGFSRRYVQSAEAETRAEHHRPA